MSPEEKIARVAVTKQMFESGFTETDAALQVSTDTSTSSFDDRSVPTDISGQDGKVSFSSSSASGAQLLDVMDQVLHTVP